MGLPGWLKHAFAVASDPGPPTPRQAALVEALCREIVRRGLGTPALAFLELSRPMNYLAAQALHFLMPVVTSVAPGDGPQVFAEFLERRGSVDELCQTLERQMQSPGRSTTATDALSTTADQAASDSDARHPPCDADRSSV